MRAPTYVQTIASAVEFIIKTGSQLCRTKKEATEGGLLVERRADMFVQSLDTVYCAPLVRLYAAQGSRLLLIRLK